MASPEPVAASVLTFGGLLAAAPLGINVGTVAMGMGLAAVGMTGRFAFDMQKAVEGGNKMRLSQALGWAGAGLIGAPFLSVLWIMILRTVGAQTDTATVLGLLFLGFTGPKGVTWLLGMAADFIGRQLPKGAPAPPKVGD